MRVLRLLTVLAAATLVLEPWSLCSRVPLLDHAAGLLVLSRSVALERGHGAGAGAAGGEGVRSLAGMGASRPLAETIGRGSRSAGCS